MAVFLDEMELVVQWCDFVAQISMKTAYPLPQRQLRKVCKSQPSDGLL